MKSTKKYIDGASICISMKKIFLLSVVVSIFVLIFQGCTEQTKQPTDESLKLVTVPLNTLGLRSDELPPNASKLMEIFDDTEKKDEYFPGNVTILEVYNVFYDFNSSQTSITYSSLPEFMESNITYEKGFLILMVKYNSSEAAASVYAKENETFFENFLSGYYQRISAEQMGDESAIGIHSEENTTEGYQILFRKLNIFSRIYTGLPLQEAIYYTKILINHIETSLS